MGNYEKVLFFNPDLAQELAEKMELMILSDSNKIKYENNRDEKIEKPYCENWEELFEVFLKN